MMQQDRGMDRDDNVGKDDERLHHGADPTPQAARAQSAPSSGRHAESEVPRGRASGSAPVSPTRLLLADDDLEMRRALASALRREGYVVTEARDGNELLEKIQASQLCTDTGAAIDALVTDIRMPGRSGIDALIAVRGLDPGLPVVLITAFGDAETHDDARWMGADAVLDKPFEIAALREVLRQLAPPM
jgi:CheY-like chemotaxis protein